MPLFMPFFGGKNNLFAFLIEQDITNFHIYVVFFSHDVTPKKTQYHYDNMIQLMSI